MTWTTANIPDQTGKTIIVTGANTGLGLSDARLLAQKGAAVILACRNIEKGEAAAQSIRAIVPNADLRVWALDLSSMASVREFAARCEKECERVDVLINNAGVMMPPKMETADGFELQFGTNHLGHFLLTGLLLPLLNKAPAPRVVSLSSIAHRSGRIDFDNLNAERGYSKWKAYAQSKLACVMYAVEFQRRLERSGSKIISVAAHPGATKTELARYGVLMSFMMWLMRAQTPDEGAMPTLRAATDPAVKGGEYYGPAGFNGLHGPAVLEKPVPRTFDTTVAERLWQVSEKMTGITYP